MRHEDDKELIKSAFKEAAKEWLNDKYAEFGKWSIMALAAAFLVAVIYFILKMNGWNHSETFYRTFDTAFASLRVKK